MRSLSKAARETRDRNIKKYMLAVLFNSVSTVGSYYQAEVNHDMYYPKAE